MTRHEAEEFIKANEEVVKVAYEHYKKMHETLNRAKVMLLTNKWPKDEPSKDS